MTDATPVPQFSDPTATVPLADLAAVVLEQVRRERDLFLALVDERERMLGIAPRTAEIRKWWREQQRGT